MRTVSLAFTVIVASVLTACSSGVTRESEPGGVATRAAQRTPVSNVSISLSPAAQKMAADNPKFSQEQLFVAVKKGLEAKGLVGKDASAPNAQIIVTEFRVRGTASAIMLGALAGNDHVTGDVILRDKAGKEVRRFTVNASYGLGGFVGGQDDMRLSWLYDKFAEHTAAELSGEPPK